MPWPVEQLADVSISGLTLLFIKALLILLVGALLAGDMGMSPAAVRHRVRFATLLCLVLLPLLTWVAPRWQLQLVSAGGGLLPASLQPLLILMLALYLAGVVALALTLLWEIGRLVSITLRSAPAPAAWTAPVRHICPGRKVRVRTSTAIDTPLTWGNLWPVILLPATLALSVEQRRMVLLHELGHIQRGDWLAHLLGQIVAVLYWPIPGLRHTLSQLSLEAEQACDNQVLAADAVAPEYAALLLAQARGHRLAAAVPLSRQSQLAQRIRSICTGRIDHSVVPAGWGWLLPLCLLLMLPLSGLRLAPLVPEQTFSVADPMLSLWLPGDPRPASPGSAGLAKPARIPLGGEVPRLQREIAAPVALEQGQRRELRPEVALDLPAAEMAAYPTLELPWREVRPQYPSLAVRRQIEGSVTIRYDIALDGRVSNVRVVRAHPAGVFEPSVLAAAAAIRPAPVFMYGHAVELRDLELTFLFRLQQAPAPARPP